MPMSRIESGATARIQAKLAALPDALQQPIIEKIGAAADQVLAAAQKRVPVDHGELKQSITLTRTGPFSWTVSANAIAQRGRMRFNYGWFVEFGTNRSVVVTIRSTKNGKVRMRQKTIGRGAHPFLFPAFRAAKKNVIRDIQSAIRRALELFPRR